MGFIIGLVALVAAFFTWQQLFADAAFNAYLGLKLGRNGPHWKICFWASVGFAAWSMLTFNPIPAYVAMLFLLVIWVFWLSSDAGQKFLKGLA